MCTCIHSVLIEVLFLIKCIPLLLLLESVDYDPGPYNILFSAGETIKSFNISIFDNNTFEALETFNLIINPSRFVSLGTPHQTVIRIMDDDSK